MSGRRFLTTMIASWLGLLGFAALINYVVDPYGLFDAPRVDGFNLVKPRAGERSRTAKAYQVLRRMPSTLIVGNSRPEIGLDPASRCWPDADRPVYNLSLPGAAAFRQGRYAQHAVVGGGQGGGKVRQVVWGVDFTDFIGITTPEEAARRHWSEHHFEFDDRLLVRADGSPNPWRWYGRFTDQAKGLFSLEGAIDSVSTVLAQDAPNAATLRADGFNPAFDYLPVIHREGQAMLFAHKLAYLREFTGTPGRDVFMPGTRWSESFQALTDILRQLREAGVEVILFINPYHADYMAVLDEVGKWDQFEDWKRTLVGIAADTGVAALWDFNAYNRYTLEPSPPAGDRSSVLRWFWEPAHYRAEYGELMLSIMLPDAACTGGVDAQLELGTRIDAGNLEAHLARLRAERDVHLGRHAGGG
ncbi:MAG: hypothetical protein H6980_06070 [Gammaproteobacteria bacterium]|nr:hypothetical protein [Gammaproteobacteria bacterium]